MLIQYKCMPPLPPTRFYRLGALREDWAGITCAQSSLSTAVSPQSTQHSLHASFYSNASLPVRLSSFVSQPQMLQVNHKQRPAKTKRFVREIKLRKSCQAV